MTRVLITGMSGTGKSSAIAALARRGFRAVDVDAAGYSEVVSVPRDEPTGLDPGQDWVWREDRMRALLASPEGGVLFVGGCSPNQGAFYPQFDYVIHLSAPPDVIAHRLATRTTNPYGQRPEDIARTLALRETVEPLLRRGADHEIDATRPLGEVVAAILRVVGAGA